MTIFGIEEALEDGFSSFYGRLFDYVDIDPRTSTAASRRKQAELSDAAHYYIVRLITCIYNTQEDLFEGWSQCNPLNLDQIENLLRSIAIASTPSEEDHAKRTKIIQKLQEIIEPGIKGYTGFTVEPYGSFMHGMYTSDAASDDQEELNLTLVGTATYQDKNGVTQHIDAHNISDDEKLEILHALKLKLESEEHNMSRWEGINHGTTRSFHFYDKESKDMFDVSVGSVDYQFKSAVVAMLGQYDWRVGALLRLVKLCASKAGVYGPAEYNQFDSYTLTLMVIFFLQNRKVPILPPLCELFLKRGQNKEDDECRPCQDGKTPDMSLLVVAGERLADMQRKKENDQIPVNQETLLELFASFLALFAAVNDFAYDISDEISRCIMSRVRIDTWRGCFSYKSWGSISKDKKFNKSVEDPFNSRVNCFTTQVDNFSTYFYESSTLDDGFDFVEDACRFDDFNEIDKCFDDAGKGSVSSKALEVVVLFKKAFGEAVVMRVFKDKMYQSDGGYIDHIEPLPMYEPITAIASALQPILPSLTPSPPLLERMKRTATAHPTTLPNEEELKNRLNLPTVDLRSYDNVKTLKFDMNEIKLHWESFMAALVKVVENIDMGPSLATMLGFPGVDDLFDRANYQFDPEAFDFDCNEIFLGLTGEIQDLFYGHYVDTDEESDSDEYEGNDSDDDDYGGGGRRRRRDDDDMYMTFGKLPSGDMVYRFHMPGMDKPYTVLEPSYDSVGGGYSGGYGGGYPSARGGGRGATGGGSGGSGRGVGVGGSSSGGMGRGRGERGIVNSARGKKKGKKGGKNSKSSKKKKGKK